MTKGGDVEPGRPGRMAEVPPDVAGREVSCDAAGRELRRALGEARAALRAQAEQQAAVAEFGRFALAAPQAATTVERAVEVVAEVLAAPAAVFVRKIDETSVRVVCAHGLGADLRGQVVAIGPDAPVTATLLATEPVAIPDWASERRYGHDPLARATGARSSLGAAALASSGAYGMLAIYDRVPRDFAADDANFMQAVALILGAALERQRAEEQLRDLAVHDPLTGLPNRVLLTDRLAHAVARTDRVDGLLGVYFLDLDDFKVVNDTLGHRAGDRVMVQVAGRLSRSVRTGDTVARFGGDEFVVVCEDLGGELDAFAAARRMQEAIARPIPLDDREVAIGVSVGVALARAPGPSADELIRDADVAMYQAKEAGRGKVIVFDELMGAHVRRRVETEAALRKALDRRELELHFQPVVELASGAVVGAEALVRWRRPRHGLMVAANWVPLAEDAGLIVPIGRWITREACRAASLWQQHRPDSAFRVAVNLSARQLIDPELPTTVAEALDSTGLPACALSFEIPASVAMSDVDYATATLHALRQLGVGLGIDDFGLGSFSLARLEQLRMDYLKIDKSLVAELYGTRSRLARAAARVADTLGLTAIAAGVERPAQRQALGEMSCPYAQGYHFAPPLPVDDFTDLLARFAS